MFFLHRCHAFLNFPLSDKQCCAQTDKSSQNNVLAHSWPQTSPQRRISLMATAPRCTKSERVILRGGTLSWSGTETFRVLVLMGFSRPALISSSSESVSFVGSGTITSASLCASISWVGIESGDTKRLKSLLLVGRSETGGLMMPSTEFESGPSSDRGDSSEEMVTLQSPLRCWQTQSQNCVLQFSQLHKQFEGTGSRSPPA